MPQTMRMVDRANPIPARKARDRELLTLPRRDHS
jgi:hypothetical protein